MFRKKKVQQYSRNISGVEIFIERKKIKNLYVKVSRQDGKVRASVPVRISDRDVDHFLASKIEWIKQKISEAKSQRIYQSYSFETGEVHFLGGKKLTLHVHKASGKQNVWVEDDQLMMKVKPDSDQLKRQKLMNDFYRAYLKEKIPDIISYYEPILNVKVSEFGVKRMKTRWGSCNITKRRIWLNLELAKFSDGSLRSVIVHEMVHLLERYHNKRFYGLMDLYYPDWRLFENELNSPID